MRAFIRMQIYTIFLNNSIVLGRFLTAFALFIWQTVDLLGLVAWGKEVRNRHGCFGCIAYLLLKILYKIVFVFRFFCIFASGKLKDMTRKKHKTDKQSIPRVEEPPIPYNASVNQDSSIVSTIGQVQSIEESFDSRYDKLKAEADEKFGQKERMSVEEYFGKLRYMVNAHYENM